MRIAMFPDDYLPDSTLVHAKMFHELAIELKRLGHEAIIITPSHGKQAEHLKIDFIDDIEVWRFRNPPMRGQGKIKRLISESLLSYNSYRALKNFDKLGTFDACINYSPSIFFGALMHWFKKKQNAYIYLILRDIFPQWVIDEGIISPRSPLAYYFRFFEKLNYKSANSIGLMSQANIDYFSKFYPHISNLQVLRNWADITPYNSSLDRNIRKEFSLENKVIFFYGGNIGHAQDMGNILRLVKKMKVHKNAHFLLVGQGDEVDLVLKTKLRDNLDNITFLPSVNQDQYKQLLLQVDVGLFSLAKTHKAHNFPGKLLGYMVQSLPILGSVNEGNDLIKFINDEGAGNAFVNGEDENLFNAAVLLFKNKSYRIAAGLQANRVLKESFSVEAAAAQLIETIGKK
ncbi:glycosyltransferase family 4 protein [Psychromonas sp. MME2]|uniref:glycosyltransferase family 4 protein n=1 Tax=Psychromonas sp. MME2 TaxID=3231033 RepID=UPI00339BE7F7